MPIERNSQRTAENTDEIFTEKLYKTVVTFLVTSYKTQGYHYRYRQYKQTYGQGEDL